MSDFRAFNVSKQELRRLLSHGYIAHAQEISKLGESGRKFIAIRSLSIPEGSCFVLTKKGLEQVKAAKTASGSSQENCPSLRLPHYSLQSGPSPDDLPQLAIPSWNQELKELHVAGQLVKRFHRPARNQETILSAFQKSDWERRIADPLPVEEERLEQTATRRLQDAIRSLNRHQANNLLVFRGDGSGTGLIWESREIV